MSNFPKGVEILKEWEKQLARGDLGGGIGKGSGFRGDAPLVYTQLRSRYEEA